MRMKMYYHRVSVNRASVRWVRRKVSSSSRRWRAKGGWDYCAMADGRQEDSHRDVVARRRSGSTRQRSKKYKEENSGGEGRAVRAHGRKKTMSIRLRQICLVA